MILTVKQAALQLSLQSLDIMYSLFRSQMVMLDINQWEEAHWQKEEEPRLWKPAGD
ncbi:hypothetical protein SDC9_69237 [bioreactor metagenome]|uniref:Uncharacterized protein n=1 Tax=bioreactor metagenome TaxID=1076179 RepID=A0A644Y358_9ZZZZ